LHPFRFAFQTLLSEVTPAAVDWQVGERARELHELLLNLADSEVDPTQECGGYPGQAHGGLPEQTSRRCGDYRLSGYSYMIGPTAVRNRRTGSYFCPAFLLSC
jgi:hypothetical protein